MFVTNWISTTKIQKISEITNFFRHYFLSRTEVECKGFGLLYVVFQPHDTDGRNGSQHAPCRGIGRNDASAALCTAAGMSPPVCHRQGGRQAFRCEYQCRSGVGTEEYGSGHLAHPHLPESSCCRSTGSLCSMAESGQWLATLV